MEQPLVAPFVAELFQQHRNKVRDWIVRMNRRLGTECLDVLDDRRGILDTLVVRRDDQGHQRKLHEFLILAFRIEAPRNPSVGQPLVTKIGTHLHRVRRQFDSVDVILVGHRTILPKPNFVPCRKREIPSASGRSITRLLTRSENLNRSLFSHDTEPRAAPRTGWSPWRPGGASWLEPRIV